MAELFNKSIPASVVDDELMSSCIQQLLMTTPGERVMRGDYGSKIMSKVHDNSGLFLAQRISDDIKRAISKWIPFIKVLNTALEVKDDEILIDVAYRMNGVEYNTDFNFPRNTE